MEHIISKKQMDGAIKQQPFKQVPKRYVCIAKIDGNNHSLPADCLKHRCSDLLKYVAFLDKEYPGWRWFNVYANRGEEKGTQLGSFTKFRRPTSARM